MKLGITSYDEKDRLSVEVWPRNVLNMVLQDVWHQMSWEKTYRFPVTTLPANRGPVFQVIPYSATLPACCSASAYVPAWLSQVSPLLCCFLSVMLWFAPLFLCQSFLNIQYKNSCLSSFFLTVFSPLTPFIHSQIDNYGWTHHSQWWLQCTPQWRQQLTTIVTTMAESQWKLQVTITVTTVADHYSQNHNWPHQWLWQSWLCPTITVNTAAGQHRDHY